MALATTKLKQKKDLGPASVSGFHRVWIAEQDYEKVMAVIKRGATKRTPKTRVAVGVRADAKVLRAQGRVDVQRAYAAGRMAVTVTTPSGQTGEGNVDDPFAADGPSCGLNQVFYLGGPNGELSTGSSCSGGCPAGMQCLEQYRFTLVTDENGDTYEAAAGRCTCSR